MRDRKAPAALPTSPWTVVLVLLLAVAAYMDTLRYDFVWDDRLMLSQTAWVRGLASLPQFLQTDFTGLTGGAIEGHYYRPLLAISLALDAALWGLRPAFFHLTNVLLHGGVTLLVLAAARSLGQPPGAAALAAALFAIHSVHAESVAWVAARQELLLTAAVLGCLLAHRRWLRSPGLGLGGWLAALGLQGMALLAKEPAVILPALLVLSHRLQPPVGVRAAWPTVLLRSLPFWALSAALLLFRLPALQALQPGSLSGGGLLHRLPVAAETFARYALLSVAPYRLQPVYALEPPASLLDPWPALGLAALGVALALLIRWRRRAPGPAFALAWWLVALLPVLDLIPVSQRAMGLTERYLYLPSVGICLLLAAGIVRAMAALDAWRVGRIAAWVGLAILVAGYSWSLLRHLPVWQDDLSLYRRMVEVAPDSPVARFNLGLALLRQDERTEAAAHLARAVALDPALTRPRVLLALVEVSTGRAAEGFRRFDAVAATGHLERDYFLSRASAHLWVGEWAAAAGVAAAGLRRFPEDGALALRRAEALDAGGSPAEAAGWYRRALALQPDLYRAALGLGQLLARTGQTGEAESLLRQAAELRPDRAEPLRTLARLAEARGDRAESLRRWRGVLEISGDAATVREALDHARRLEQMLGRLGQGA